MSSDQSEQPTVTRLYVNAREVIESLERAAALARGESPLPVKTAAQPSAAEVQYSKAAQPGTKRTAAAGSKPQHSLQCTCCRKGTTELVDSPGDTFVSRVCTTCYFSLVMRPGHIERLQAFMSKTKYDVKVPSKPSSQKERSLVMQ
jgi:hypothetical protein